MKIVHRFFSNGDAVFKDLVDHLQIPHKFTNNVVGKAVAFEISEDDEKWIPLSESLGSYTGLHSVGTEFSKKEIGTAKWLFSSVGEFQYPQPEDEYLGLTYDLSNACSKCEAGKQQLNPFRLKSDFKQKRSVFFGLHWVFDAIFTRPEIVMAMEKHFDQKFETVPVLKHPSGKPIADLVQIRIPILNKEFVVEPDMNIETCEACGIEKRIRKERGMIACRYDSIDCDSPLFLTNEWFGSGASSRRQIIASNEFMHFVETNKFRGFKFQPTRDINNKEIVE